jgi:hypothetical protein
MYGDSGNTTGAGDIISTKEMNKSLEESDSGVDPNTIHLVQSSYLKKINNELIPKYNKHRFRMKYCKTNFFI